MKIIFTQDIVDEDMIPRDCTNSVWEISLWSKHRNYNTEHERAGQSNLLVVSPLKDSDGWFLSFESFRHFLRTGIVKIVK